MNVLRTPILSTPSLCLHPLLPSRHPHDPDCFPDATFYDIGYADICFVVSLITLLAVLRDGSRLLLLKPFANWKLTRDWRRRSRIVSGFRFGKSNVCIIVASPPHTKPSPSPNIGLPHPVLISLQHALLSRSEPTPTCPFAPTVADANGVCLEYAMCDMNLRAVRHNPSVSCVVLMEYGPQ